jgi:aspartate 1-decarboxylase
MIRTVLSGKIHRCRVTFADLNYVGSITLDPLLMQAANMVPFERVQVVNVTNGNRWETYAITGNPGDGGIQVNGGGARLVSIGDILIVMSYVQIADPIPADWQPRVVMVDARNRITEVFGMGPQGRAGFPLPEEDELEALAGS